ncbi:MAG: ParB/RepB/Spo0J family partition protein [Planctomycetota bacterium]
MAGRKLGRGLQFLLSQGAGKEQDGRLETAGIGEPQGEGLERLVFLGVEAIAANPDQPRQDFDPEELEGLAESIRRTGLLQPILVRESGDRYELIAGERRLRAAKLAGLDLLPAIIRKVDDPGMRLLALAENLQREDLNPIEKATAFRELRAATGWTHEQLAKELGLERSSVSNFLRLLELSNGVQALLKTGKLSMGHARAILAAPESKREELARRVIREKLSVRAAEKLVSERQEGSAAAAAARNRQPRTRRGIAAWALEMQDNLRAALGCRVSISYRGGKGRIGLELGTRQEFDRVYELLMNAAGVPGEIGP